MISAEELPLLTVANDWTSLIAGKESSRLERILPAYLRARRWFAGKARTLLSTRITERLPVRPTGDGPYLLLVQATYREGDPDTYLLPLSFTAGQEGNDLLREHPGSVVARARVENGGEVTEGVVHDAVADSSFTSELLELVTRRRRRKGDSGTLTSSRTRKFNSIRGPKDEELPPSLLGAEQSNTSIVYGDRMILKLFRRLDRGTNPDLEIGRFLTERTSFENAPQVAGALSYDPNRGQPMTLAIVHEFVPNEGDAWKYSLDELARYFERVLARPSADLELDEVDGSPLQNLVRETPRLAGDLIGGYLEFSRLLGQRTGELHIALASRSDESDFAPEPINAMYRRSLYQASRVRAEQALDLLRKRIGQLPKEVRGDARSMLDMKSEIDRRLRAVVDGKVRGSRIRCHGDYHLGQVLFTGRDFVIMDFEGEPARPISERTLKRSPLRDVAGMLRSFDYATVSALLAGPVRPEDVAVLEPYARYWYYWVAVGFLKAYLETVEPAALVPQRPEEQGILLDLLLLDKALYEVAYELNNRPDWVRIPLRGILDIIEANGSCG